MIYLRANKELRKVYGKLIRMMQERVDWNGVMVIRYNSIILLGNSRSLYFDLDRRTIYSSGEEISLPAEEIFEIDDHKSLVNCLNMILYIFGKWNAIKGLKVEQDYMRLTGLFFAILQEVEVKPYFTAVGYKMIQNHIQITYEEVIELMIEKIKQEETIEEEEEFGAEIGLWHDMEWKVTKLSISKSSEEKKDLKEGRIGTNFYKVSYLCSQCGRNLHMVVYPEGKEFRIDTEDGVVYLARAYTCPKCNLFVTPRPKKLLQEGDVYCLILDDDETATNDYRKLLGRQGTRKGNGNFNLLEADYLNRTQKKQKPLFRICSQLEKLSELDLEEILAKLEEGFFSDEERMRFQAMIEQELYYRRKREDSGEGEFGSLRASNKMKDGEEIGDFHSSDSRNEEQNPLYTVKVEKDEKRKPHWEGSFETVEEFLTELDLSEETEEQGGKADFVADRESEQSQEAEQLRKINGKVTEQEKEKDKKIAKSIKGIYAGGEERYADTEDSFLEFGGTDSDDFENSENVPKEESTQGTYANTGKENQEMDLQVTKKQSEPQSLERQWEKLCYRAERTGEMGYFEVVRLIQDMSNATPTSETQKEEWLQKLERVKISKGRNELDHIIFRLPKNFTKEDYRRLTKKIEAYRPMPLNDYQSVLDGRIDVVEKAELSRIISQIDSKNRKSIIDMMERLKKMDVEQRNREPFQKDLQKQLEKIDEETLHQICPDPADVDFREGLAALEKVQALSEDMVLPYLKANMAEMLDKRLTKLKADECQLLVEKLKKMMVGKLKDSSKIFYYDVRKMLRGDSKEKEVSLIRTAVSTYATTLEKYEYPVMIMDSSVFSSAKEGIILTPDHLFYKGLLKSGVISVEKIESIDLQAAEKNKGLFVQHKTNGRMKLPCTMKQKDMAALAGVLQEFIEYLKDKPESRSISYLSKSTHTVKCCYRCGFEFQKGNICPKCGSKNK